MTFALSSNSILLLWAWNRIKSVLQTAATTFAFSSVFFDAGRGNFCKLPGLFYLQYEHIYSTAWGLSGPCKQCEGWGQGFTVALFAVRISPQIRIHTITESSEHDLCVVLERFLCNKTVLRSTVSRALKLTSDVLKLVDKVSLVQWFTLVQA